MQYRRGGGCSTGGLVATDEKIILRFEAITSELDSALNRLDNKVGETAKRSSMIGGAIGAALGGVALKAVDFAVSSLTGAITSAGDLAESVDKVGLVFGDSSSIITDYADQMAADFGKPKGVILEAAANIGGIGKQIGMTLAESAKFGTGLVQLAADAASFHNVPLEESLVAIRSGLTGEMEPLKRFGVFIDEAAVKTEAARMAGGKLTGALTNQQKVLARQSLITKQLADAQGNLALTSGSFANQVASLQGRWTNFTTAIMSKVIPAFTPLVAGLSETIEWFQTFVDTTGGYMGEWHNTVVSIVGPFVSAYMEALGAIGGAFMELVSAVGGMLGEMGGDWGATMTAIGGWLKRVGEDVTGFWNGVAVVFRNLGAIFTLSGLEIATWAHQAGEAFAHVGKVADDYWKYLKSFGSDPIEVSIVPTFTDPYADAKQAQRDRMQATESAATARRTARSDMSESDWDSLITGSSRDMSESEWNSLVTGSADASDNDYDLGDDYLAGSSEVGIDPVTGMKMSDFEKDQARRRKELDGENPKNDVDKGKGVEGVTTVGVAEFARSLQQAAGKGDLQKDQLSEQKRQSKFLENIDKNLGKPQYALMGA